MTTARHLRIVIGMIRAGMVKNPSKKQLQLAEDGRRQAITLNYAGRTDEITIENITAAIARIERNAADGGTSHD